MKDIAAITAKTAALIEKDTHFFRSGLKDHLIAVARSASLPVETKKELVMDGLRQHDESRDSYSDRYRIPHDILIAKRVPTEIRLAVADYVFDDIQKTDFQLKYRNEHLLSLIWYAHRLKGEPRYADYLKAASETLDVILERESRRERDFYNEKGQRMKENAKHAFQIADFAQGTTFRRTAEEKLQGALSVLGLYPMAETISSAAERYSVHRPLVGRVLKLALQRVRESDEFQSQESAQKLGYVRGASEAFQRAATNAVLELDLKQPWDPRHASVPHDIEWAFGTMAAGKAKDKILDRIIARVDAYPPAVRPTMLHDFLESIYRSAPHLSITQAQEKKVQDRIDEDRVALPREERIKLGAHFISGRDRGAETERLKGELAALPPKERFEAALEISKKYRNREEIRKVAEQSIDEMEPQDQYSASMEYYKSVFQKGHDIKGPAFLRVFSAIQSLPPQKKFGAALHLASIETPDHIDYNDRPLMGRIKNLYGYAGAAISALPKEAQSEAEDRLFRVLPRTLQQHSIYVYQVTHAAKLPDADIPRPSNPNYVYNDWRLLTPEAILDLSRLQKTPAALPVMGYNR